MRSGMLVMGENDDGKRSEERQNGRRDRNLCRFSMIGADEDERK